MALQVALDSLDDPIVKSRSLLGALDGIGFRGNYRQDFHMTWGVSLFED